jgi:hypothetical protein
VCIYMTYLTGAGLCVRCVLLLLLATGLPKVSARCWRTRANNGASPLTRLCAGKQAADHHELLALAAAIAPADAWRSGGGSGVRPAMLPGRALLPLPLPLPPLPSLPPAS